MCGISGFLEMRPGGDAGARLAAGQAMTAALALRGPDDEGIWQDPDVPMFFGQRRLAVIDLSAEGHQPMVSASGRYVVNYNGEIYNYRELAAELGAAGVKFRGRSDTEVMLAAFEQWGVNRALQKLNGMFAIALWDRRERCLHLVRDRLGKKPLYIGWAGSTLVFASELKALRAHPGYDPGMSRAALALYMRYGCVPAPYAIYDNTWQLLPGCRIVIDTQKISPGEELPALFEPYWHLPRVVEQARTNRRKRPDEDVIAEFLSLLRDAVACRMISDVPLGAFLSGGIDSSLVVALMQERAAQPVKTYSIGFREQGFDESAHAAAVARHLGTDHHELYVTPAEAQAVIPQLATIYDEPFADVSQLPTYILSRFARQDVTVALSGDGGDELCGGYLRHYVVPAFWRRIGWLPRPVRRLAAAGIESLPPERWDSLVPGQPRFGERIHKIAALLPQSGADGVYRRLVSQFDDPAALLAGDIVSEPLIPLTDPAWQPQGLGFAERMIYGDTLSYLPNDVLAKVDRASMACSLEARAPLLDYRLFEYAWSLPLSQKIRNGQGKWLPRQVLARYVPPALTERPKQGFAVPVGQWLRGSLRGWAEDLLDPRALADGGILNPAPVAALWREHLAGGGRHEHRLWTILMLRSWQERWQR